MAESVRRMFAGIATRYDLANRVLSARRDVAWRRGALAHLDPPPQRVLDLACGTFDLSLDALAAGRASTVHGCDFCLPMLQAGTAKREQQPISATAGDGLRLPFADAAFDAAVMAYGWRNFDNPAQGLAELKRVVRPGGQILILEFFRPTTWWPRFFQATFGRVMMPLVGGLVTGDAAAYRYLDTSIRGFVSLPEACELFASHGMDKVTVHTCFGGVSHGLIATCPPASAA